MLFSRVPAARAEPPPDYYGPSAGKAGSELRSVLHAIISNHRVISYDSTTTDTADALTVLDQDLGNPATLLLLYSTSTASVVSFGPGWNREHMWPDSYGLDEPAQSDLFNLRACDS